MTNAHITTLLNKHFDIALETPDGIKKLRELILTLAMQGKLVPQDPDDQPASELLKEIQAEKARLIKEGKIKKQKDLPPIKESEIPYKLPKGWEWVRMQTIFDVRDGTHDSPKYISDGIPLITSKNFKNGEINFSDAKMISYEDHISIKQRSLVEKNDILFSMIGGNIGNMVMVNTDKEFSIKNVALFKYYSKKLTFPYFLMAYLQQLTSIIQSKAIGGAQPFVSLSFFRNNLFPLPPLNEQKRIVAKIDQLMSLCDQMQKQRDEHNNKRLTIHTASMNKLLTAPDSTTFKQSWNFITKNFNELYSVIENVGDLKKAILQLAVMGKLVPQDPNDQPASELLKEIQAEKARLIKEGKIKKQKDLPPIKESEIPYKLPKGWEWVRLGNVCEKITDGDHKTPPRVSQGKRLLSAKNVRDGFIDYDNCDFISEEHYINSRKRCCPEIGDLLIVSVGGTIGRTSLVLDDDKFALVRSVALIKSLLINSKYLRYAINSDLLQTVINNKKRGGAQPCLYLSEIEQFNFPLPPLKEQKRIVSKIDQLLNLCNDLEKYIKESEEKKKSILNSVLAKI